MLLLGCFALSLCGCGECKHSWTEADCTTASVCSKCGESGSEALGHSWVEATCQAPDTCSVCGATQGAVLEHVFGGWSFLEETMTRSCENCALEETHELDYQYFLDQELPGVWTFSMMVQGEAVYSVNDILSGVDYAPSVVFLPDGGYGTQTVDGIEELEQTWAFHECTTNADNGFKYLSIAFTFPDSTEPSVDCALSYSDGVAFLVMPTSQGITLMFEKSVGDSVAALINGTWSTYSNGEIFNLNINEDRSFTADFNGGVHGFWQALEIEETEYGNSVPIVLVYEKDEELYAHYMELSGFMLPLSEHVRQDSNLSLYSQREINGDYPSFYLNSEDRIKEILQDPAKPISGYWTSIDYSDGRSEDIVTNEYSLEIKDDGTFSAVLDSEVSGTWELSDISIYSGEQRCTYKLSSEAWDKDATLSPSFDDSISLRIRLDDHYENYTFAVLSDEDLAKIAELKEVAPTMIVGEWTSVMVRGNDSNGKYFMSNAAGNSVTFSEDGTFSGYLSNEVSGTWEYRGMSQNDDYNGDGMKCDFGLKFDGGDSFSTYIVGIADGKLDITVELEDGAGYMHHTLYQWSAEELQQFEAERKELVGSWKFKEAYFYDQAKQESVNYDAGESSLELADDGSFTAQLDGSSCPGTWAYEGMKNNSASITLSFADSNGYSTTNVSGGIFSVWRQINGQYITFAFEK